MNRIWLLFAATSALHFLAGNEADNDLWVHLFTGRRILSSGLIPRVDDLSFTAAGAPWVDHEWLVQALFALLYDSIGPTGLWLAKVAVGGATAWLLWRSIRRSDGPLPLQVVVLMLILAALSRGFAIRPQVVTYLFVAALLVWLDSLRNRPVELRTAVPLVAAWLCLWSNLHGAFIVGLGILGLWSISPPWNEVPARLALPAVAFVAACLNPYGPYLFTYIWGELSVPHPLTEWQPVHFGDPAQWPFWTILIGTALTLPFARTLRASPWRAVLLAGTAVLALRHQRHVPLFAICAAAPLADQIGCAFARAHTLKLSDAASRIVTGAVLVMAVVQFGLFVANTARDRGEIAFLAQEYPVGAVRYMQQAGLGGSLALPLDWGGYAMWHLSPRIRVSMDGRFATVYSPPVVAENFALFDGTNDHLLINHRPDYVLTMGTLPLRALAAHDYHPLYRDPLAVLYSRKPSPLTTNAEAVTGRIPFP